MLYLIYVDALGDEFFLPPKRLLATCLFPSGWIDDLLISERKTGLAMYLSALLWSPEYRNARVLHHFLRLDTSSRLPIDLEDCLPSILSHNTALASMTSSHITSSIGQDMFVASAYYPAWSASSVPPESIDYHKYDMLFFGLSFHAR